jgi:hypothetical protein
MTLPEPTAASPSASPPGERSSELVQLIFREGMPIMIVSLRSFSIVFLTSILATAACSKPAPEGTKAIASAEAPAAHAPANVKPGSHEDWCAEHAVPESQCTRCNTDLVAAFKATGDWCAEHGLPESQCLKCNPELKITRPPKGQ